MVTITQKTTDIVRHLFRKEAEQLEVIQYLQNDCSDNIWDRSTAQGLERLWFAVLKLSKGRLDLLVHAIAEAQTDYRDVLMAADFGFDVNEHLTWAETILRAP